MIQFFFFARSGKCMAKKAAQGRTQRLAVPVLAAALAAFASRRGSTAPKLPRTSFHRVYAAALHHAHHPSIVCARLPCTMPTILSLSPSSTPFHVTWSFSCRSKLRRLFPSSILALLNFVQTAHPATLPPPTNAAWSVRVSLTTNPQHTFSCALPASELSVSYSH